MHLPLWPLKRFLRTLPDGFHTEFISHMTNHLLRGHPQQEQLMALDGKRIRIAITDTDNAWQFQVVGLRLVRDRSGQPWDVRFRGRLEDFLSLATRAEDPDTLFFARRLSIEGDTEAGLYVKNLLDAFEMDWGAHIEALVGPNTVRTATGALDAIGLGGLPHRIRERVEDMGQVFRQSVLDAIATGEDSTEKRHQNLNPTRDDHPEENVRLS